VRNSSSPQVSQVKSIEQLGDLPKGLSFFDPILQYEAKEALEAGGESTSPRVPRDARMACSYTMATKRREPYLQI